MTGEGGVPGSGPGQNVAVLFSERSRRLYVDEALARGAVYEFVDARGRTKRWLKDEHAYLAPSTASAFLNRCSVKHDRLHEGELRAAGDAYHTILIPNAAALEDETVAHLSAAVRRGALRLVVTGRTNLPDDLLGLERSATIRPEGYACWRWQDSSRFSDRQAWGEFHAAGGRGHTTRRVAARAEARVLARLWELRGDLSSPAAATREEIGDAIVVTDRTVTVASSVFEFLGGVLQAHLNVEEIRHWHNPVHWGDTLVLFLWEVLREWHPAILEQRLKPFGSHRGAFSLRHDVDSSADLSMLEFQVAQLVPATYDLLDPVIAADSTTAADAALWVREVGKHSFLEAGLHNDSLTGDPPRYVVGTGLLEHVRATEARLGFTIRTCGRHGGGHVHPETLDAMDYLLEHAPEVLGTCTFCFYNMVEYGRRGYQTNGSVTIASSGFWFPFHPVITSVEEHKVLRGWDRTHEYDCDFDLIDVILAAHHSSTPVPPRPAGPRLPPWIFDAARGSRDQEHSDQLDNGVYTLQYHPLFARDPAVNHGRGTLDYLIYAVSQAERRNLWIANQRMLYERMRDYEAVRFRVEAPDRVTVFNPTERRIEGLMVESAAPVGHVLADGLRYIHVVAGRYFGVPPLEPHRGITMRTVPELAPCPQILNTTSRGLRILDARHDPGADAVRLDLEVARGQALCLWNLEPGAELRIRVQAGDAVREDTLRARPEGILKVPLAGPESGFARQSVEITRAARIG
jgi:hypothetical protein